MPAYKFYYFDLRGRGEAIRLCFAAGGIPYEDIRMTREQFTENKAKGLFPFRQAPALEVDGTMYAQSNALVKMVARDAGLCPSEKYELARADMIQEHFGDWRTKVMAYTYNQPDPQKKEQMKKQFLENTVPEQFELLEKILQQNKGGSGYFVGDKLTYADIEFFHHTNSLLVLGRIETPHVLTDRFPLLCGLYNRVMNEPKILVWLKRRPETER